MSEGNSCRASAVWEGKFPGSNRRTSNEFRKVGQISESSHEGTKTRRMPLFGHHFVPSCTPVCPPFSGAGAVRILRLARHSDLSFFMWSMSPGAAASAPRTGSPPPCCDLGVTLRLASRRTGKQSLQGTTSGCSSSLPGRRARLSMKVRVLAMQTSMACYIPWVRSRMSSASTPAAVNLARKFAGMVGAIATNSFVHF